MLRSVAAALILFLAVLPVRAEPPPEGPVAVALGEYLIRLPEGEGPFPAVIHLHGWGASAEAVMSNRGFIDGFLGRGYAVIAPQGLRREGRRQRDWSVNDAWPDIRDDAAFFGQVLDDAAAQGWIVRGRVLMTGFSRGASMVWDIACGNPGLAAAYAPVSGAFWEPLPESCVGPVNLFHTHGWADGVVPLEGRSVAGGQITQGDVFASLAILRAANGVPRARSEAYPVTREIDAEANIWWRTWTSESGARIDLMLHPGGHGVPRGWSRRALDWFEDVTMPGDTRPEEQG